jgi:predicted lipid-binding transport protein (Tim44 family)
MHRRLANLSLSPSRYYDAFERLLGDIQAAYSAEDLSALRAKVTPEMLSYNVVFAGRTAVGRRSY